MKGPGLRIDLDVRRVWKCAKCGRIARTSGQVTAQRCGCTEAVQWMHLEPAVKKEPFRAPFREHLPEEWEMEAAADHSLVASASGDGQSSVDSQPAAISISESAAVSESAERPPQTLEPPPVSEPAPAETSDVPAAESVIAESVVVTEAATQVSAAEPTAPPVDTFGAGVEEPPRNPAET